MHKQRHIDSSLWSTKQVAGQPELQKLSEKGEKEKQTCNFLGLSLVTYFCPLREDEGMVTRDTSQG